MAGSFIYERIFSFMQAKKEVFLSVTWMTICLLLVQGLNVYHKWFWSVDMHLFLFSTPVLLFAWYVFSAHMEGLNEKYI